MLIDINIKRKCVEMSKDGKSYREVYNTYFHKAHPYMGYETFRHKIKNWREKTYTDDKLTEAANLSYGFTPYAATVQVNGAGGITQAWVKQSANGIDKAELLRLIRTETTVSSIQPINQCDALGMLEIQLCDMHIGIADLDYYKPMVGRLLPRITSKFWDMILIPIGNDFFHNDNFKGETSKGTVIEEVDMTKAWNDGKTIMYSVIDAAIEHSNNVKLVYDPGNHSKFAEWCFIQMLAARYGDSVTVDDATEAQKCVYWEGCFIGFGHCEHKKSKPDDLFRQFVLKFPMEFAKAKVREIHSSHYHSEKGKEEDGDNGFMIRRMSSGNKNDKWSDKEGYIGAHKRFMVFEYEPNWLKSIHYV